MIYKFILFFFSFFSISYGVHFYIITTEYSPKIGMFSAANQVLGQLHLFETGQLFPVAGFMVDFSTYGLYYDPSCGPNWWTYFFEPVCVGETENVQMIYPGIEQYRRAWRHRYWMSRAVAAEIVKKYIRIKPHIQEKIDAFVEEFFQKNYMIGVHYRGTDKKSEAPRVAYERVFQEIEKQIPLGKAYALFIATDEDDFLKQVRMRYPDRVMATNAQRSAYSHLGVHFANKNNYSIGEEALIDASLLARCDVLIRTSSNLSLWSTYFNPDLPVVLLNLRKENTLEPE
jgi:hypothetical protein